MKSIDSQRHRRQQLLALTIVAASSVLPLQAQTPDANRDAAARTASAAAGPILVLGDSLSAEYGITRGSGWVELLRGRLRERGLQRVVVNASVSGETSAGGRARIEGLLRRQQPALVVIELGGNDALRGLDLNATRANLLDMIRRSQQSGARVLLLGMKVPPNYGKNYSDAFERVFVDVARETNVPLVPFFLDGIADRLEFFQPDRIHPNESAQARMMDNVWPALDRLLQSP